MSLHHMLKRSSSFQVLYLFLFTHFPSDNFLEETKGEMTFFLIDFCVNFPGKHLHLTLPDYLLVTSQ